LAKALGEDEIADLLSETLEEEKMTDAKLTQVTQESIMPEALGSGQEAEEADDAESSGRKKSGGRARAA
jgi:hypothetical protein